MSFNVFTSNSSKKSSASAFSLAILVGAAGLTLTEAIPGGFGGGTGFVVGFILGFVFLSIVLVMSNLSSKSEHIGSESGAESEISRQLIQAAIEIMRSRKGTTEWK